MVTLVTTNDRNENTETTTVNLSTEANDLTLHMEQNHLKAEKKCKMLQCEAACTLEALTLQQQQVQIKKLQEHARYDQLREQQMCKTSLLPSNHKFQDGRVFVSAFNPPSPEKEPPVHMAIPHPHNPYFDSKPPPADKQKQQTNDISNVYVPYKSPTVLSTITTTPTSNNTKTKDLKTPPVNNNSSSHFRSEATKPPHLRGSSLVLQPSLTHLQIIPINNNKVTPAIATHSVLKVEPPGGAPVCGSFLMIQPSLSHSSSIVQPNNMAKTSDMSMPKMNDMIPLVHKDMLDTASPTTIEVIDLTIDTSKNSPSPVGIEVINLTIADTSKKTSDEPLKKKVKTTTINIMVMVTMPGAVHPVMKKVQCTVNQESD